MTQPLLALSQCASAIEPTLIRTLRERARPDSLDLGLGQPDLLVASEVREAVAAHIAAGAAPYSANLGLGPTREAVASHYGVDAARVMITCGVQQALAVAIFGMIDAGDDVLVPEPGFPAYPNLVRAAGGRPVPYRLDCAKGWRLEAEAVERALTPKTRAIILNSPSNPTGAIFGRDDLKAVLDLVAGRGIAWISDEIYEDYIYGDRHHSPLDFGEHRDGGVKLGGLSKSHHMMGWRLGWLLGPEGLVEGLKPLHQHMVTCAPTPAQVAAVVALKHHERLVAETLAVFERRRAQTIAACRAIPGVDFAEPLGAFYLFLDVRAHANTLGTSLQLAYRVLDEANVVTIPGSGFGSGGEGFLRIAYTLDEARLGEALRRLKGFF
ncbi:MAG: pyridoxal phosphate-dependent aminotransferase [Bradymonadaceae bacterium]|nr:pyridoxal phosphate-dependent aminotransferase [Lujinxingiaceae bacterium]